MMRGATCPVSFLFLLSLVLPAVSLAGTAAETAVLPPELPWDGASREFKAAPENPWITPAETFDFVRTPSYQDTFAYLRRLVSATPELEMVSLGKSGEGRDLWLVIASAEGASSPAELRRSDKPILFAQAGIHAGEIDGKDAGLMLLRDLTVGGSKRSLLDGAHFLFLPIFNPDGHERVSPHGRINQRGPERMGWRTNARNLNLNRDYAKLDTIEMRHLITALGAWQPDLYVDLHVTDGIDYQYDITWGFGGRQSHSPSISAWLESVLTPAAEKALSAAGHIPGPLVFAFNQIDLEGGLFLWNAADPRFSDGYGAARHLPTILVENHSLKPYEQRVLGTYVLLESLLTTLAEQGAELRRAVAEDRARRPPTVPLQWTVAAGAEPEMISFLAVESRREPSKITGEERVVWTGKPITTQVARVAPTAVASAVARAEAYWLQPAWSEVIERLEIHGIEMEEIDEPREVAVEMYRLEGVSLDETSFEGRVRVTAEPVVEKRRETFIEGSVRIPTDQPLGDLAALLLEPASPDSFFQWGFFHEVLQRTEYVEGYVMDQVAERMLAEDPELAKAFEKRLREDADFAGDAQARLRWFYEQTPFFDPRWRLYPVAREPRVERP